MSEVTKEPSQELKGLAIQAVAKTKTIEELTAQYILEHAEELDAVKTKIKRLMLDEEVGKIELEDGMVICSERIGKFLDKEEIARELGVDDLGRFEKKKDPIDVLSIRLK